MIVEEDAGDLIARFCTAHSRLPGSTRPSTLGTLTPAIGALAPFSGLTV